MREVRYLLTTDRGVWYKLAAPGREVDVSRFTPHDGGPRIYFAGGRVLDPADDVDAEDIAAIERIVNEHDAEQEADDV